MQNAKPGVESAGHRGISIRDCRPHSKNTLRGFFTARLPSGLVLHDLMVHERDGARWIGFPGREWVNARGEKQYARFIDFASRVAGDRFRDAVLGRAGPPSCGVQMNLRYQERSLKNCARFSTGSSAEWRSAPIR